MDPLLAGVLTFVATTFLTVAGVGAAFVLIPIYISLGVDIRVSMATALLLNSIAMTIATIQYSRNRLVLWKKALPMVVLVSVFSPLGVYTSLFLQHHILKILFICFLLISVLFMLASDNYQKCLTHWRKKEHVNKETADISTQDKTTTKKKVLGNVIYYRNIFPILFTGSAAGFTGGLLGVGGGNIILPALIWKGYDPKEASATTAFIVIFSSLLGFLGHATFGEIDKTILFYTAIGSISGALLGSWVMTKRLNSAQVKYVIVFVLLIIAVKMILELII